MQEIPIKSLEKQSLSVLLEGSLYELSLRECNGVMAMSITRDGINLVENRRVCAGVLAIPFEYLEYGNFMLINPTDEIPYFNQFESSTRLVYLTSSEMEAIRGQ